MSEEGMSEVRRGGRDVRSKDVGREEEKVRRFEREDERRIRSLDIEAVESSNHELADAREEANKLYDLQVEER
eukprot:441718-Hanusia_phi.AAC.1